MKTFRFAGLSVGAARLALAVAVAFSSLPDAIGSVTSSSGVSGPGYGSATNFGTSSSHVVAAGAEAGSSVDVQSATMHALATIDGAQSFDGSTDTRHLDTWGCPANTRCTVAAPTTPVPMSFHLSLDGLLLDNVIGARNYLFLATYGTSLGDQFSMEVERDGSGDAPFVQANFDGVAIPVTLGRFGDLLSFSLDADIVVMETFSRTAAPSFDDSQEILLQVSSLQGPNAGPEFIDASHTFSVTVRSLDPAFDLVSADGRTLLAPVTSTVPEPPLSMLAVLGAGAMLATRRRGRARTGLFAAATMAALGSMGMGLPTDARADALSPSAARAACTAQGASTPSALRACCDDRILEDPPSKQRRLVQECVSGAKQDRSADERAADAQAAALVRSERAARAANPNGKAMKHGAGAPSSDGADGPSTANANANATTTATAANAATNCANAASLLAQVGDLARRFGHSIRPPDCPPGRP